MNKLAMPMLLLMLGFISACVTINVYFPAAAAEQAADRIIDQVYGDESRKAPPGTEGSSENRFVPATNPLISLLELVIPSAHAASPDFDIQTPAVASVTKSMEKRHKQLAPFYEQGGIGMTSDGELDIRDLAAIPLQERNKVKQLVAAENRDRNALYQEIARANGHPEWEADIRSTFARRWIAKAPAGWWYEDKKGSWKQK